MYIFCRTFDGNFILPTFQFATFVMPLKIRLVPVSFLAVCYCTGTVTYKLQQIIFCSLSHHFTLKATNFLNTPRTTDSHTPASKIGTSCRFNSSTKANNGKKNNKFS